MACNHLTVQQVAADLQVHERTVQRWIADGALTARRVGPTLLRINVEDLDDFLRGRDSKSMRGTIDLASARPLPEEHRA